MQAHGAHAQLQAQAAALLKRLATHGAGLDIGTLFGAAAVVALTAALVAHPRCAPLVQDACRALCAVRGIMPLEEDGTQPRTQACIDAGAAGAIEAAIQALNEHAALPAVAEQCLLALALLLEDEGFAIPGVPLMPARAACESNCARALAACVATPLAAALNTHARNTPVVLAACAALKRFHRAHALPRDVLHAAVLPALMMACDAQYQSGFGNGNGNGNGNGDGEAYTCVAMARLTAHAPHAGARAVQLGAIEVALNVLRLGRGAAPRIAGVLLLHALLCTADGADTDLAREHTNRALAWDALALLEAAQLRELMTTAAFLDQILNAGLPDAPDAAEELLPLLRAAAARRDAEAAAARAAEAAAVARASGIERAATAAPEADAAAPVAAAQAARRAPRPRKRKGKKRGAAASGVGGAGAAAEEEDGGDSDASGGAPPQEELQRPLRPTRLLLQALTLSRLPACHRCSSCLLRLRTAALRSSIPSRSRRRHRRSRSRRIHRQLQMSWQPSFRGCALPTPMPPRPRRRRRRRRHRRHRRQCRRPSLLRLAAATATRRRSRCASFAWMRRRAWCCCRAATCRCAAARRARP
jgi:SWI/SNF-related matrix-associated actin-dependent regulator 1 of chromatin subfamily A